MGEHIYQSYIRHDWTPGRQTIQSKMGRGPE